MAKRKPDKAHRRTDKKLAELEKRIAAEYKKAADELSEKIKDREQRMAAFISPRFKTNQREVVVWQGRRVRK